MSAQAQALLADQQRLKTQLTLAAEDAQRWEQRHADLARDLDAALSRCVSSLEAISSIRRL